MLSNSRTAPVKLFQVICEKVDINFNGTKLKVENSVRYLGYDIQKVPYYNTDKLNDTNEIVKRIRDLYKRANMLKCKFNVCSLKVKKYLFVTYVSTVYCLLFKLMDTK